MLRYMICPIVAPVQNGGPIYGAYHSKVSELEGVNSSSIIPTHTSGPDIGKPKYNFALCVVSAVNWLPVLQITNSYVFPVYALDAQMSGMETDARTGLVQSVEAFDMDGNGLHLDADHNSTDSYRHVLEAIGQQLEPAMTMNTFSVAEVSE